MVYAFEMLKGVKGTTNNIIHEYYIIYYLCNILSVATTIYYNSCVSICINSL